MSNIYKLLTNVQHNSNFHEVGSVVTADVFDGEDSEAIKNLIGSKAIELVEGASTIEEATKIIAEQQAQKEEEERVLAETAPKDTWAPAPEESEDSVVDETVVDPNATNTSTQGEVNAPAPENTEVVSNQDTEEDTGDQL